MEQTNDIKGYKRGSMLFFERGGKKIVFDLKDMKFYRPLKRGDMKPLLGSQAFFRNLSVGTVAANFQDEAYAELMRLVARGIYSRHTNFGSVFQHAHKYSHLEGYLLLGIPVESVSTFKKPVSIYPKEILAFMRESGITFSNYWEQAFLKHPKLLTDLCTHVRKNHYLDLEVYRMLEKMCSGWNASIDTFALLVSEQAESPKFEEVWRGDVRIVETGYGCEYKTLFSYLVRIDRTEACNFNFALGYYRDYLKMSREMERNKQIAKLREVNPTLDVRKVGYVGYGRVEKYPSYLRTRHDIVQKNYRDWQDNVDEKAFRAMVEKQYAYSWNGFHIVVPKSSNDVKAEGATLHHCVASYISRIMDGTTQIVFLRQNPEESLATVEIRAGAIVQARGYNNRSLTAEEDKWLKTFAKAKNLSYKDVKRNEKMPTPPVVALQKYDADAAILRELSQLVNG